MTSHADFLKVILENPDEDSPRLIYADYLEEQGDSWAEFIRVQIEIANWEPPYSPWCGKCGWVYQQCSCGEQRKWPPEQLRLEELQRRERELLIAYPANPLWLGKDFLPTHPHRDIPQGQASIRCFGKDVTEVVASFRRGFIERLSGSVSDFQRAGWELLREHPVRNVILNPRDGWHDGSSIELKRLHLRKQQDGTWAAHWLRMEDKEPGDIDFKWGDFSADHPVCIHPTRNELIADLPEFLTACLAWRHGSFQSRPRGFVKMRACE